MTNRLVEGVFTASRDPFPPIAIKYHTGFMTSTFSSVEYLVGNFSCTFCMYIKQDQLAKQTVKTQTDSVVSYSTRIAGSYWQFYFEVL